MVYANRSLVPVLMLVCVPAFVSTARPAELTLFTNAPPGSPLVITPLDTSDQLLASIVSAVAVDPPTEYVTGWQFRLRIIPDANAAGALNFGAGTVPGNYIFDQADRIGPSSATLPGDATVFTALDIKLMNNTGVPVPIAPGFNLLSISFVPEAGALGNFGIYAVADSSLWIDTASAVSGQNNQSRDFVNVPADGGLVRIADVLVASVADYNRNGVVDAADYTVWRDTLGAAGTGLAADGNGDSLVDDDDYNVWKSRFGETVAGGSGGSAGASPTQSTVPEPGPFPLLILGASGVTRLARRRRSEIPRQSRGLWGRLKSP